MNSQILTNITWTDSDREDIKCVRLARKLGFDALTSYQFRDGTQIPPDMLTFNDGYVSIWFSVKDEPHWVAAETVERGYVNHRQYADLKTALVDESFI